jgi:hypothetical protein
MEKFVHFISHPASGWLRKSTSGKRKAKSAKDGHFSLSPDSFHSRSNATKRDNPRFNPAP